MKIVIAPDSFKESLTAKQAAAAIATGLRRALPEVECVQVPLADGGEGTVEALLAAVGGRRIVSRVTGPLRAPVSATWGLLKDGTAVIEMAAASGLMLVPPDQRNPLRTTSYGTGELIQLALARGARRILLGIGGSATNEAGAGMAQALGVQFRDLRGRTLRAPLGGGDLAKVADIVVTGRDPRLAETTLLVACDVTNPLVGPRGASAIYGPQKGATPAQVRELEQNLRTFGRLASQRCGKPLLRLPGGGAAGGLGAGLVAFAGGQLVSGAQTVMAIAQLERHLQGADLVITGEGKLDAQTRFGKTPASVAELAQRMGIPVVGLAGMLSCDANINHSFGFDALLSAVVAPENSASALRNARGNLIAAAERLGHWLLLAQRRTKR